MNIYNIINWCNDNVGFATILLSVGTLIISIIAIIISINTSRLPFKKRLRLETGSFFWIGVRGQGIHVTAINIGNRNIVIKTMGLLINGQCCINIHTIKESQISLAIGESTTQYFDDKNLLEIVKLSAKFKVFGYVEDTEGQKYKKYICKVETLIKKISN
jgi:hypothetical protein